MPTQTIELTCENCDAFYSLTDERIQNISETIGAAFKPKLKGNTYGKLGECRRHSPNPPTKNFPSIAVWPLVYQKYGCRDCEISRDTFDIVRNRQRVTLPKS